MNNELVLQIELNRDHDDDVGVLMDTPVCRRINCVDCVAAKNRIQELAGQIEGKPDHLYGLVSCAIQWDRTTVRMNCVMFGMNEETLIEEKSQVFCPPLC